MPWSGTMLLGVGWAMINVRIGENRAHRHVAHQISLALDSPCEIDGAQPMRLAPGEAALIPAGVAHSLSPIGAAVRTIYIDPLFRGMRNTVQRPTTVKLHKSDGASLRTVDCGEAARQWIDAYLGTRSLSRIDHRLQTALGRTEPGTSPAKLAKAVGLSSTRLRELAVRDFGVPTTKLLQWLQLQHAIDTLRHSASLADAAAAGGFSDQAHFTRRLVEWFGVTPSLGLAQLEISIVR
ncbi:MAG: AraC family transcriptional regulator [Sphingomonadaceae bacterium]|nr:AraC family transcriptional regulator [Sphingomonadaceae bacterium]